MSKKATAPSWVRIIREPLTQFELAQTARTDHAITTPQAAYDVFRERAEVGLVEAFYVATLNTKNKLISLQEVSRGSLNASIVEPREVVPPRDPRRRRLGHPGAQSPQRRPDAQQRGCCGHPALGQGRRADWHQRA